MRRQSDLDNLNRAARVFVFLGALAALVGIALGAYATHGLKDVAPAQAALFQTALQYHLFHSLGLLVIGALAAHAPRTLLRWAGAAMFAGLMLFCLPLYLSAVGLSDALRPVTPVGGFAFLAAWLLVGIAALTAR